MTITMQYKSKPVSYSSFDTCPVTLTMTLEEPNLANLLESFEWFLRGCGFYLDGNVEVVPPEEDDSSDHST